MRLYSQDWTLGSGCHASGSLEERSYGFGDPRGPATGTVKLWGHDVKRLQEKLERSC